MNKKMPIILVLTGLMVFIFCMVVSKVALDKINRSTPEIIIVDEDDPAYSYYSKSIKINNAYYEGKPFVIDNEMNIIYIPVSVIEALMTKEESTDNLLEEATLIDYRDERYISLESITSSGLLNIYESDDGLVYIDNFKAYDYSWVSDNRVVAHALGGIDNHKYTNCEEAMIANYEAGYRVFEVDIMMTSDGIPVFGHDWKKFYGFTDRSRLLPNDGSEPEPLSYEEYCDSKIYDEYTPLTMESLALFMSEHPDMYVITDTKATSDPEVAQMFESIVEHISSVDETVLDRIIPQIYNDEMLDSINSTYEWKSVIYTLYNLPDDFSYEDVFNFSYENGIRVFTFSNSRSNTDFINNINMINGYAYMHTFNDEDTVKRLIETRGIYGVYSDYLEPVL